MRTTSWVLLTIVGALTLLISLLSANLAYRGDYQIGSAGTPVEEGRWRREVARRVAGGGSEDRLGTLAGDQENTMQPVKGRHELREKSRPRVHRSG